MHPIYSYIKQTLKDCYSDSEAGALAKWILTDVFHFTAIDLYAGRDTDFSASQQGRLEEILLRLKRFEPMQYILGETSFGGYTFEVSPAVLIPRPETEELVDWVVSDFSSRVGVRILDIGTGSGCIPITLYKRLEEWNPSVASWDISEEALAVAHRNAQKNRADVSFRHQDILADTYPRLAVDVLVSNPPYITASEKTDMEHNVLDWEPGLALFVPDTDPLKFYRRIAEVGCQLLVSGGTVYFEINRAYGRETMEMLESLGYHSIELRKDFSGNDRMIKACRR